MLIHATEDTNQETGASPRDLAECPKCGQKLFAVESLCRSGVFRIKCRRCKRYIRVYAREGS